MKKRDHKLPNDFKTARSFDISLATALLVVMMITSIELIIEGIKASLPGYNIFIGKFLILIVLGYMLYDIMKDHQHLIKAEAFLAMVKRGKKK